MKLHFRKTGNGPNVVILHGLFGSSDNWQTFARQLAEHGYTVYTVDLRNHGLSPHHALFNYEVMAEDVSELIRDEHMNKVVMIGHSLGGKTAMTYAFKHAGTLAGLIVIDIAPRQYPVQHRNILEALQSIDTGTLTSRKEAEEQLQKFRLDAPVIQFLMKNLYRKEKDRFAWRFNLAAIAAQIEKVGTQTLPESPFAVPTLFVKAENADYITYEDEREIYERFVNVEVKTAPQSGHWVHAENPVWLLENTINFLSGTTRNN